MLAEAYERLKARAPQTSCDLVPHLLNAAEETGGYSADLSSVIVRARSAVLCVPKVRYPSKKKT